MSNIKKLSTKWNTEIPDHPWLKCAADLFHLQGHYYLLIVDYYSKFIAIKNLQNPQSKTVINKCKKLLSQFGIPNKLIMDNSSKFSCHKFCSFSKTWDTLHKMISPHYHQSMAHQKDPFKLLNKLSSKQNLKKLLGHKLRTTLPSLIPFTQSTTTKKHTITQNLRHKLPEIALGTTRQVRTNNQNFWGKKGIIWIKIIAPNWTIFWIKEEIY